MIWNVQTNQSYETVPFTEAESIPRMWLWEPYLPSGSLVVLDGDPGVGKTLVAVDLAARLSRGGEWPDGKPSPKVAATGFFANHYEDGYLRPQAEAARADLEKLVLFRELTRTAPTLPGDRDVLTDAFVKHTMLLLVVDPLPLVVSAAAVGSHAPSAWHALEPLMYAISRTGTVALLVRHRTKLGTGPALFRGLGGISLAGAARSALLVVRHPDEPDLRLLVHTKSNLAPPGPTLGFRIVDGAVKWEGPVDVSAEEIGVLPEAVRVRRPRERAAEWLKTELANGPRNAAELIAEAAKRGIPPRTLHRAKCDNAIRARQIPNPGAQSEWLWYDPHAGVEPPTGILTEVKTEQVVMATN